MTMVVTETSVILDVFVDESFFLPLFLHVYVYQILFMKNETVNCNSTAES